MTFQVKCGGEWRSLPHHWSAVLWGIVFFTAFGLLTAQCGKVEPPIPSVHHRIESGGF